MTETDIVDQVYRSGEFASEEQAESVTRATLRNLGRSLSVGEAQDLGEPLPQTLSEEVLDVAGERAKPMAYDTFLEQIGEEVDLGVQAAERAVQVVMTVLAGRVGEEELENAQAQLPPNYGRVFDMDPATIGRPFEDIVAERGSFDVAVDVEKVAQAIVETLGERLTRGEAQDLAQYLEGDAQSWLVNRESPDAADFSAEEFVDRVAVQAEISEDTARDATRVVGDVLHELVPSRELDRARGQLPTAFDSLFGFDS